MSRKYLGIMPKKCMQKLILLIFWLKSTGIIHIAGNIHIYIYEYILYMYSIYMYINKIKLDNKNGFYFFGRTKNIVVNKLKDFIT